MPDLLYGKRRHVSLILHCFWGCLNRHHQLRSWLNRDIGAKKKSRWLAQLFTELTLHFYFVYCLRNLSPFLSRRLTSVTITEQKLPYKTDLYSLSWLYQSYHIGYESCIVNSLYVQLISKLLLTGVAFHKHTSIIWMKTRDDILRFERKKKKKEKEGKK